MSLHIYTAAMQPATLFVDNNGPEPFTVEWPGNRMLMCRCCWKRRPARNCVVQCCYDGMNFWCAHDKGCKHPKLIAAKKRRAHLNRSAGQRRRWRQS